MPVDPSAKAKERCALPELTGKRLLHARCLWLTLRQCRTKMGRMNSRALGLPRFDIGKHTVQLRCLTCLVLGSFLVVWPQAFCSGRSPTAAYSRQAFGNLWAVHAAGILKHTLSRRLCGLSSSAPCCSFT